jgi:glycerol uptake facilitator-like aquaporin
MYLGVAQGNGVKREGSKVKVRLDALFEAATIADQNAKLSVFATRPAINAPIFNWLAEFMATVMLIGGAFLAEFQVRGFNSRVAHLGGFLFFAVSTGLFVTGFACSVFWMFGLLGCVSYLLVIACMLCGTWSRDMGMLEEH